MSEYIDIYPYIVRYESKKSPNIKVFIKKEHISSIVRNREVLRIYYDKKNMFVTEKDGEIFIDCDYSDGLLHLLGSEDFTEMVDITKMMGPRDEQ